jgi:hypothetical protein
VKWLGYRSVDWGIRLQFAVEIKNFHFASAILLISLVPQIFTLNSREIWLVGITALCVRVERDLGGRPFCDADGYSTLGT